MSRPADGADLARLAGGTYVRLTTFRRDGRAVSTPVWPVADRYDVGGRDGDVLVTTGAESGKVKRLRHTASVLLAPCDARGRVADGVEDVSAVAQVLDDDASYRRARRLTIRKHPVISRAVGAARRCSGWLARRRGRPGLHEVTLRIHLADG